MSKIFQCCNISNEVFYDVLSQRASKLPQLEDSDFSFYFIKTDLWGNFKLEFWQIWCPLGYLMPLRIECPTVLHLKSLRYVIEHRSGHWPGSTLTSQKSVWKVLILLHKQVKRQFHLTVFVCSSSKCA